MAIIENLDKLFKYVFFKGSRNCVNAIEGSNFINKKESINDIIWLKAKAYNAPSILNFITNITEIIAVKIDDKEVIKTYCLIFFKPLNMLKIKLCNAIVINEKANIIKKLE